MIYAVIDPVNKSMVFSNAGHPPPVYSGPDGVRALNFETGFPLGIIEDPYPEHTIKIDPGSRLLIYSDGVNEAMNPAEDEYGEERIINQMSDQNIDLTKITIDVQKYMAGSPASDDITLVMIKSTE
jgi:sigma-B regulation protein RsbU (phosphoserine phosphatase)